MSLETVRALADEMAALRKKINGYDAELRDLAERETLTRGQEERYENVLKAAERAAAELASVRRQWEQAMSEAVGSGLVTVSPGVPFGDLNAPAEDPLANPRAAETPYRGNPWKDLPTDRDLLVRMFSAAELRSRAYSAIELMPAASDALREHITTLIKENDDERGAISEYVLATSDPAYLRAFARALRGEADLLTDAERLAVRRVRDLIRAMSLTDAAGGYAVPTILDPTLQITGAGSQSDIARIARQVITTANSWNGVTAAQISASYDTEAAEVSDDAPTLSQATVDIHTARVFVPASLEIVMDEPNWTEEVTRLMVDAVGRLEAEKFAVGTGTNEPEGIVTGLTGTANEISSASTDTFALTDVYSLFEQVPARHRDAAGWLANELTYDAIRQFDTAGSAALWAQLAAPQPGQLLGRPTYRSSHMDGTINATQENRILICGDFESAFVIARRVGFTVEFVPHLFGTTSNRPSGQRGLFGYARNGSAVVDANAAALLNVT